VRGKFLTGFPWNFVGASQYQMLPVIQIASFTGIYGVSFLVVWTSVSLGGAGFGLPTDIAKRLGGGGLSFVDSSRRRDLRHDQAGVDSRASEANDRGH